MLIRAVRSRSVRLANTTLRTSYGSHVVERDHLFVALEAEDGTQGYGEGSPLPHFSGERAPEMRAVVRDLLGPALVGRDPFDAEGAQAALDRALPHHGASKAALTSALFDLQGKLAGLPVHRLLGGRVRNTLDVAGAIGIETPEAVVARVGELMEAGHTTVKLKVGGDVRRDIRVIQAVRNAHGGDVALRADANGGYARVDAFRFVRGVADAALQYFEQPLRPHDLDGLARLRETGDVPIAVDESLFGLQDALEIVRRGAADVFVIKLIKLGGLHVARKVLAVAEAAGVRCTAVSPYESSLGVSANVHLVAASSTFAFASELGLGVSTVRLPGGEDLDYAGGRVGVSDAPGLGIDLPEGFFAEA